MRFDIKFTDEQVEIINKVRGRNNVEYIKKLLSDEARRYDDEEVRRDNKQDRENQNNKQEC